MLLFLLCLFVFVVVVFCLLAFVVVVFCLFSFVVVFCLIVFVVVVVLFSRSGPQSRWQWTHFRSSKPRKTGAILILLFCLHAHTYAGAHLSEHTHTQSDESYSHSRLCSTLSVTNHPSYSMFTRTHNVKMLATFSEASLWSSVVLCSWCFAFHLLEYCKSWSRLLLVHPRCLPHFSDTEFLARGRLIVFSFQHACFKQCLCDSRSCVLFSSLFPVCRSAATSVSLVTMLFKKCLAKALLALYIRSASIIRFAASLPFSIISDIRHALFVLRTLFRTHDASLLLWPICLHIVFTGHMLCMPALLLFSFLLLLHVSYLTFFHFCLARFKRRMESVCMPWSS